MMKSFTNYACVTNTTFKRTSEYFGNIKRRRSFKVILLTQMTPKECISYAPVGPKMFVAKPKQILPNISRVNSMKIQNERNKPKICCSFAQKVAGTTADYYTNIFPTPGILTGLMILYFGVMRKQSGRWAWNGERSTPQPNRCAGHKG